MGSVKPDETTSAVAHLYRRAGFGLRPDELDAAAAKGYDAAVARLTDLSAPDLAADAVPAPDLGPAALAIAYRSKDRQKRMDARKEARRQSVAMIGWWIGRMVASQNPLREKLALFWHGHFATSLQKVKFPELMYRQNQLFRSLGGGSFEALAQAVAKDPAMLVWLDSNTNHKGQPNENFARELMELFTLGIGNYTETDVKEAARAFTGWRVSRRTGGFEFRAADHDEADKTVLGRRGALGGEDVVRLLVHQPASHRFVVAKVWGHFARPVPTDAAIVPELAARYAADLNVAKLLRAMFLHPDFVGQEVRSGLVKTPVEYVAGALRALGVEPDLERMAPVLRGLGQLPFVPPNVGGWPQNGYWLTTASSQLRLRFATSVARMADVSPVSLVSRAARPEAAARLVGVVDGWSPRTAHAIAEVADDPRAVVALALVAPEYVVN